MTSRPPSALERKLCFAMYSTAHAFNRLYKPHLDRIGLTYPQYLALLALWEQDAITVKRLGEQLMLDSGTLTPLLKRLEIMGLVTRQRDSKDQRQVIIALSKAGADLKQPASAIPDAVACATGLTLPEFENLLTAIQSLRTRLLATADETNAA